MAHPMPITIAAAKIALRKRSAVVISYCGCVLLSDMLLSRIHLIERKNHNNAFAVPRANKRALH